MLRCIDNDETEKAGPDDLSVSSSGHGGTCQFTIINESGLYNATQTQKSIVISVLHVRLQAFFAVQVELKALRMFRFLFRMTPITRVRARLRLSSNAVLHDVCPDCERGGRRIHALEIKHCEMQEFLAYYIKNLNGHGGAETSTPAVWDPDK